MPAICNMNQIAAMAKKRELCSFILSSHLAHGESEQGFSPRESGMKNVRTEQLLRS